MSLPNETIAALQRPLAPALVSQRNESGRTLSYIEGFTAIDQANSIFGFDGWSHEVVRLDYNPDIKAYLAIVRVRVGEATHEDVGTGLVQGDRPTGHETAMKGAVTDALKRALRAFGDQFGNSLYDRDSSLHTEAKAAAAAPPVSKTAQAVLAKPPFVQEDALAKPKASIGRITEIGQIGPMTDWIVGKQADKSLTDAQAKTLMDLLQEKEDSLGAAVSA